MYVYKCDMCLKEIQPDSNYLELVNHKPHHRFLLCDDHDCGGPVVNFLQLKELLSFFNNPETE